MEKSVLTTAKSLMNKQEYARFYYEYNRIYKYVDRLKPSTQFSIVHKLIK
jgi:hypothetical protein